MSEGESHAAEAGLKTASRREFVRVIGGGAAVSMLLPLLSACGPGVPGANTAPAGATVAPAVAGSAPASGGGAKTASALPAYFPAVGGPKPDFPGISSLYQDGFATFPTPIKALPSTPPGAGTKVISNTNNSAPAPPTPLEQNPAWQEVNRQLNAEVQFNITVQADYNQKLATMMAGDDLTDLILVPRRGIQNLTPFLEAKASDLTPYLAGDLSKDYPFLASIPTYAWKNSGSARNGKLYLVPLERPYTGFLLLKNSTIYDNEIGKDYTPKNAADFKRVMQQLTRPDQNRWAMGSYSGQMYYLETYFTAMFGAPSNWLLDSSGKLIKDLETPQYKEAVAYVRDLVAAGVFHPDSLSVADSTVARNNLLASKVVFDPSTMVAWQDAWARGPALNPPVIPHAVLPFAAHDGEKPVHFFYPGFVSSTMLKKAPPERIKELLRIMNWLAAPFGSAEDLLLTTGVKDIDYTVPADGDYSKMTVAPRSNTDAHSVPWQYIVQRPQVAYLAGVPEYAKAATDFEKVAIPLGVADPTFGFTSATYDQKGLPLTRTFVDGLTDVLAGRRALTDFDALVRDWKSGGGDVIRTEFEKAIAAG
jgi:putative aldouronate transport system substrate-binding protein